MVPEKIQTILENIPGAPGIYLMKNKDGDIIYVGKAKNLKKRVTSYFHLPPNAPIKVKKLVSRIDTIEHVATRSDLEALILETNYIKENKPKYNILMRDDKNHLYIKITKEDYPRIYTVRNIVRDGSIYFGPKTSSSDVKKSLKLLRKLFPYRSCNLDIVNTVDNVKVMKKTMSYPCIYYHIKRCIGPCIKRVPEEYGHIIDRVIKILEGDFKDVMNNLKDQMSAYAHDRKFEKAIETRDLMNALTSLLEKQNISHADPDMFVDVIGMYAAYNSYFFHLFQIRGGKLIGHENFSCKATVEGASEQEEALRSFLLHYYQKTTSFPEEIYLPQELEDIVTLRLYLTSVTQRSCTFLVPKIGKKKDLIALATHNAENYAVQQKTLWYTEHEKTKGALLALQKAIGVSSMLRRIECYDISHLHGTSTVGSQIVFIDGKPSKKDYRRFTIKTLPDGTIDDFASLQEVLFRRLKKIQQSDDDINTPDLIVIDGGKGQLSSVMEIAEKLQIDIPIISLAKQEEEIFLPYNSEPILLPRHSQELYLIQNIRDEAHRFAITFNRALRAKKAQKSILDTITGIGPRKKKELLKKFGDVHGIAAASQEELTPIVGAKVATLIKELL